jgi:secreted Zn-dependent insulinase-like peptidase
MRAKDSVRAAIVQQRSGDVFRTLLGYHLQRVLYDNRYEGGAAVAQLSWAERLKALDAVAPSTIPHVVGTDVLRTQHYFMRAAVVGNTNVDESPGYVESVLKRTWLGDAPKNEGPLTFYEPKMVDLASYTCGKDWVVVAKNEVPTDTNTGVLVAWRVDNAAHARVYEALMAPAFFESLRTQQQLGYVVQLVTYSRQGTRKVFVDEDAFVLALVQSAEFDYVKVVSEIRAFIKGFGRVLANVSADDYATAVRGVVAALQAPPESLADEFDRLWADVMDFSAFPRGRTTRRFDLAFAVNATTQAALVARYNKTFGDPASTNHVTILSLPSKTDVAYNDLVTEVKASLRLPNVMAADDTDQWQVRCGLVDRPRG